MSDTVLRRGSGETAKTAKQTVFGNYFRSHQVRSLSVTEVEQSKNFGENGPDSLASISRSLKC